MFEKPFQMRKLVSTTARLAGQEKKIRAKLEKKVSTDAEQPTAVKTERVRREKQPLSEEQLAERARRAARAKRRQQE